MDNYQVPKRKVTRPTIVFSDLGAAARSLVIANILSIVNFASNRYLLLTKLRS